MTLLTVLALSELAVHEEAPLIMPPLAFAGIAAAIFIALGFVSWSFRDVANRHSDKAAGASSHQDTVH
jgi:uncharacterized membrane protein YccC